MAGPSILSIEDDSPDEFRMRLVALVSLDEVTAAACGGPLARHGGRRLAESLAVFPGLEAAARFACAVQRGAGAGDGPRPAIGINLGAPARAADLAFAHELRARAAPGETLISAITGNRLTSRVRADGPNEPLGWRLYLLPAVGLACFLGYFLGWFYAIFWQLAEIALTGHSTCCPDWLCR
jgi:hypothetical protein